MLHLFQRKTDEVMIKAPVDGQRIPLEAVPDPVFASGMMGVGCGFHLMGKRVVAPCDGEVLMIANTSHAIGLQAQNGMELLLHVGLDTVDLKGRGFTLLVKKGQKVHCGQPMIELDLDIMEGEHVDLTTPMVITNASAFEIQFMENETEVTAGVSEIIRSKKR